MKIDSTTLNVVSYMEKGYPQYLEMVKAGEAYLVFEPAQTELKDDGPEPEHLMVFDNTGAFLDYIF